MLVSKRAVWYSIKSRLTKEPEASGLLSQLGIRTHLRKIPLLADILF